MSSGTRTAATLDDLMKVDGKAELIAGRTVRFTPTGLRPNQIAAGIYSSLAEYAEVSGRGFVGTDNLGFAVPELSSGRQSFSPDASYYDGPLPADDMDFIPGPPTFAIEVRSKGDYGPAAETAMAAKRADHFEAGTRVVWDVDPQAGVVRSYSSDDPSRSIEFVAGQVAHAEPAVPGWRLAVDDLFA